MLITLVESLHALAPVISARHWFFWVRPRQAVTAHGTFRLTRSTLAYAWPHFASLHQATP
jgi:hypothetical protein